MVLGLREVRVAKVKLRSWQDAAKVLAASGFYTVSREEVPAHELRDPSVRGPRPVGHRPKGECRPPGVLGVELGEEHEGAQRVHNKENEEQLEDGEPPFKLGQWGSCELEFGEMPRGRGSSQ